MSFLAETPEPPYFVVVFTSVRTPVEEGYGAASDRMEELARAQPGFLGLESARTPGGIGITISYWASEDAIAAWRAHAEHVVVQRSGVREWYEEYVLRVGRIDRQRRFEKRPLRD